MDAEEAIHALRRIVLEFLNPVHVQQLLFFPVSHYSLPFFLFMNATIHPRLESSVSVTQFNEFECFTHTNHRSEVACATAHSCHKFLLLYYVQKKAARKRRPVCFVLCAQWYTAAHDI